MAEFLFPVKSTALQHICFHIPAFCYLIYEGAVMSEMHERDYNDYYRIENEKIRSEGSFAPFTFLCTVIILICAGLLMLYSASYPEAISNGQPHYYFVLRQGIFALLGIACAAAIY